MRKPHKVLAVIITVALVFALVPTAFAESEETPVAPQATGGEVTAFADGWTVADGVDAPAITVTVTDAITAQNDEQQAQKQGQTVTIKAFDKLDKSTAAQVYAAGAVTEDELTLPDALKATENEDNAITIKGVAWKCESGFDGEAAGEYIFVAVLPEGYALTEDIKAPTITVTISVVEAAFAAQSEIGIGNPGDVTGGANLSGTAVYYGSYGGNPIKWYVVANDGTTATLWTTTSMGNRQYNSTESHQNWSGSDICAWLNGTGSGQFLETFGAAEQVAIATYSNTLEQGLSGDEYTPNQQIVLPSVAEISDGGAWSLTQTNRTFSNGWWLRSPGNTTDAAAVVYNSGIVFSLGHYVLISNSAVRPAFKLNLSSVLFTSAAAGGKSSIAAGDELSAAEQPTGELKLTIEDSALTLTSVAPASVDGRKITFNYTGATVGKTLSAIVKNSSGKVTYYGKLAENIAASGTTSVTVPDGFASTDTLEIFVEELNGDKYTDYASATKKLTVNLQSAPTPTGGINTITGVTAAMEYKLSTDTAWTAVTGTGLTGLTAGSYEVRYKGVATSTTATLASPTATVTVTASTRVLNVTTPTFAAIKVGDAQPTAQAITIANSGNSAANISGVTVSPTDAFEIGGSGASVNAGGSINTWTVRPKDGIAAGTHNATITVAYDGTAGATATAQVSIVVNAQSHAPINPPDKNTPIDLTKDIEIVFPGEWENVADIRLNGVSLTRTATSATQADLSGYKDYGKVLGNAKKSSVAVTLYKEFLQWLPNGEYKLEVVFNDGGVASSGAAEFLVKRDAQPTPAPTATTTDTTRGSTSPQTGDESNIQFWIALMLVAGVGMAYLIGYRKKQREQE